MKYIHFFSTETRYSLKLLEILSKNIDLRDHTFIFGFAFVKPNKQFEFISNDIKIVRLNSPFQIINYLFKIFKSSRIYIHLLPYDPTLIFWFLFPMLVKKSTWIEWGTDIYSYYKKDHKLQFKLYELLRRVIIPGFGEIAGFIEQDLEKINELYQTKSEFVKILYPIPLELSELQTLSTDDEKSSYSILIGNSGDPSNNHLEIINILERFKNENIKIYCPLSYGGNKEYIEKVVKSGILVFSDKFVPIVDGIKADNYFDFLKNIDIAVMFHNRQQGLGNILPLLYLGKKVFVKSATTTYSYFKNLNVEIFDSLSINTLPFTSLVEKVKRSQSNMDKVKVMVSEENYVSLWSNLFKKHQ